MLSYLFVFFFLVLFFKVYKSANKCTVVFLFGFVFKMLLEMFPLIYYFFVLYSIYIYILNIYILY